MALSSCLELSPRDRSNQRRFTLSTAVWAAVYLASTAVVVADGTGTGLRAGVALFTLLASLPVVLSFARYVRQADELVRSIELQALAIAAGVLFVLLPALRVVGAFAALPLLDHLPLLALGLTHSFASTLLHRSYR